MAKTPEQITAEYEAKLAKLKDDLARTIDRLYNQLIKAITPQAAAVQMPSGIFSFSKVPALNKEINRLIKFLNQNLETVITSGINGAWELSNIKNNLIADLRIDKTLIPLDKRVAFYDTNINALKTFEKRVVDGMNLSQRIYKAGEVLKSELEAGLGAGIARGQSAAEMGRDLRQYLKYPDKLFRRVRDEEGVLRLSKNAKAFKPGQGVYRSSRANIERLTRTETNMAYRKADNERFNQMPFVLGYEVKLSGSHVKCDMCDAMAGEYPNDFVFVGWHPHCLCYVVPVLMTPDQFKEYRKLLLTGNDTEKNINKIAKRITSIPKAAQEWIDQNNEKILQAKNLPYWYRDNPDFMPQSND